MVSDPKTLHYMFHTSGYDIIKQPERKELSRLLTGKGLIWAEGISLSVIVLFILLPDGMVTGDVHRRQRKVMNPAFGPAEARAFFPIFLEHANQVGVRFISRCCSYADADVVGSKVAGYYVRVSRTYLRLQYSKLAWACYDGRHRGRWVFL